MTTSVMAWSGFSYFNIVAVYVNDNGDNNITSKKGYPQSLTFHFYSLEAIPLWNIIKYQPYIYIIAFEINCLPQ